MGIYDGMTVNERRYEAKLIELFDEAIKRRDKDKAIEILISVELSLDDAKKCCEAIFTNPKKYGY